MRGILPCSVFIWKRTETSKQKDDLLLNGIKLENKIEFEYLMGLGAEWGSHRESAHPHCGNYTAICEWKFHPTIWKRWLEIPAVLLWAGEKWQFPSIRAWPVGVLVSRSLSLSPSTPFPSLSLSHTHSHTQISVFSQYLCINQKMIPYGLQGMYVHAHTQGYIFPLDPTIHVTQHTMHSQIYITQTPSWQKHVNPRHILTQGYISYTNTYSSNSLYTYQGGTSSHASVSSLTCLPTCSTTKDTAFIQLFF